MNMHQNISHALVEMHDYKLIPLKVVNHLLECISNLTYILLNLIDPFCPKNFAQRYLVRQVEQFSGPCLA